MTSFPRSDPPPWVSSAHRLLGRYLLGPILGEGSSGVVHEAWDTVSKRVVALKRLTAPSQAAYPLFAFSAVSSRNAAWVITAESAENAKKGP